MYRTANDIRKSFRKFFVDRGHAAVPSSSLIPAGDATLMFANSGMVQFKDTFLGLEKRPYSRAVTSQKSMRVSGKHNDFENVGPSPRHHTFFEMLGNFSFGDYFKKDAIQFAWDLLVNEWGLEPERLWFTVFKGDDEVPVDSEAIEFWKQVGADPTHILKFGRKDNFWQMGEIGPCGPCSEIHYYRGEHPNDPQFNRPEYVNGDGEETIEIWNLVFMQFNRSLVGDGKFMLDPLPRPSVDTGAGLERIAAVMQGKLSNYETDLFTPIIEATRKLLNAPENDYFNVEKRGVSYRVIADHVRAVTFLIADGVNPSNAGRGYVTRLILRRAARHGQLLGFTEPFVDRLIPTVIDEMGEEYPEIIFHRDRILKVAREEEEKFLTTLRVGSNILDDIVGELKAQGAAEIPGDAAFKLFDTYGFPLDLTREVARENNMIVDESAFQSAMAQAKATSRKMSATGKMDAAAFQNARELYNALQTSNALPSGVHYNPYEGTKVDTHIVGIVREGELADELATGERGQLVLADTCFYVESGGQISDTGIIVKMRDASLTFRDPIEWSFRVDDTRQPVPGFIVHIGEMVKGSARVGERVVGEVDAERRMNIMRNHTATHLLHAELRRVLGTHVHQAGSLVAPDRLRFDFTHTRPVGAQELAEIESGVNNDIFKNDVVEPYVLPKDEAIARGAMALFGEKYGDVVRMMEIDGISRELCGGTHVANTGQIGLFHIVSESSVASGVRRIEAVSGRAAYAELHKGLAQLERVAEAVNSTPAQVDQKIGALLKQLDDKEKEIQRLRRDMAKRQAENVDALVQDLNGVRVLTNIVEAPNADALREQIDFLRDKLGSGIIALGAVMNGKPSMLVAVTPDLVAKGFDAQKIVRASAPVMGGGGGGKPTLAQAGGKDASKLQAALDQVLQVVATGE